MRLARSIGPGIALGPCGFRALPERLGAAMPNHGKPPVSGVFMRGILIDVHHYALDNVMWRKELPDTGRYLSAHR